VGIANLISPIVAAAVDHRSLCGKILTAGNQRAIRDKKSESGSHDAIPVNAIRAISAPILPAGNRSRGTYKRHKLRNQPRWIYH
jgi:hypothetical protein